MPYHTPHECFTSSTWRHAEQSPVATSKRAVCVYDIRSGQLAVAKPFKRMPSMDFLSRAKDMQPYEKDQELILPKHMAAIEWLGAKCAGIVMRPFIDVPKTEIAPPGSIQWMPYQEYRALSYYIPDGRNIGGRNILDTEELEDLEEQPKVTDKQHLWKFGAVMAFDMVMGRHDTPIFQNYFLSGEGPKTKAHAIDFESLLGTNQRILPERDKSFKSLQEVLYERTHGYKGMEVPYPEEIIAAVRQRPDAFLTTYAAIHSRLQPDKFISLAQNLPDAVMDKAEKNRICTYYRDNFNPAMGELQRFAGQHLGIPQQTFFDRVAQQHPLDGGRMVVGGSQQRGR